MLKYTDSYRQIFIGMVNACGLIHFRETLLAPCNFERATFLPSKKGFFFYSSLLVLNVYVNSKS